ncbi:uncharacterized protein Z519_08918 [Cladophialophora bantiana CBS 173.52]|uniref:Uncharacterized protein n=1 Tax=Cladophialophora bantiana (strain ATCC 10958 / CBS 173.52 / CDC B-1940 / NIH 8579) TaxID=1442370 RepID=A0A0D2I063_CLAB1|nr:uncharacterized protein Z519_08918 [Cladophialophora bantiana CBS 173.52]KIW90274.1 hypothetical protein Z519_08918 [Cladophialophora bantiana CBS 173.52]
MSLQLPSESEILTSYLLHPSPLPAILPYKSFLALLPPSLSSFGRQHPTELKRLYRDLQFQRDILIDDVRRRIEDECRRSVELKARLGRQVRREEGLLRVTSRKKKRKHGSIGSNDNNNNEDAEHGAATDDDDIDAEEKETQFDTALHDGQPLGHTLPMATAKHNHTTTTLLAAMTTASQDLASEIADLEAQIATLRSQCGDNVGNLSDLRYGRFATAGSRSSGDKSKNSGEPVDGVEDEIVTAIQELKETLVRNCHEDG